MREGRMNFKPVADVATGVAGGGGVQECRWLSAPRVFVDGDGGDGSNSDGGGDLFSSIALRLAPALSVSHNLREGRTNFKLLLDLSAADAATGVAGGGGGHERHRLSATRVFVDGDGSNSDGGGDPVERQLKQF